jgi:Holliday junction resolvase-like predicted endonuclease
MDLFEDAVMGYLAHDGQTFLCPQFSIRDGKGGEWACPDFVALRPSQRQVLIVEVKTARCGGLGSLKKQVAGRNKQWIDKLKSQLLAQNIIDEQWSFVVKVFVRKSCVESFKSRIQDRQGVEVVPLEDATFPWTWQWPDSVKGTPEVHEK